MAGELNTEVLDVPASCRAMGDWLGKLGPSVAQVGDVIYQQRGDSESFWEGTAGDTCRSELTSQGSDGDTLEELITRTRRALTTFADQIDSVRSQMDSARGAAQGEGVIVTSTAILPPGPTPGPAPKPLPSGSAVTPGEQSHYDAAADAHAAAVAKHERQQRAFDEATAAVDKARDDQAEAHTALDKAMDDPLATVKKLKLYGMFLVGNGLSQVKTAQTTANDLFEKAAKTEAAATTRQANALQTASPAMRELGERAAARGHVVATETYAQADRVQRMNGKIPAKVRNVIEFNPGNLIKSGSKVATVSKNVLRGVPVVGTGLTVGSGVADVAMGKDAWNAAGDTAASLGGSIAGGMAFGAGLGTVFPGPGNVAGGVIGGIAGGIVATGVVDLIQGDS